MFYLIIHLQQLCNICVNWKNNLVEQSVLNILAKYQKPIYLALAALMMPWEYRLRIYNLMNNVTCFNGQCY